MSIKKRTCLTHSADLMDAIKKKGMEHLMRPELAAEVMRRWLRDDRSMFDPYVVSVLEIMSKAQQLGHHNETGVACPLCFAARALKNDKVPEAWIDNVTDLMLIVAQTNSLMSKSTVISLPH